jgi:hypothetical protein
LRYYIPDLDVRPRPAAGQGFARLFSPRSVSEKTPSFGEKLGGHPDGLPSGAWPRCNDCGGGMTLIGQFNHHTERLNLGREGRRLFVFTCENDPGMCASWETDSGANACIVLEPEALSAAPATTQTSAPVLNEAVIAGWCECDDEIDEALRNSFFDDSAFFGTPEQPGLSNSIVDAVPLATKFGSVPRWLQGTEEGPVDHEFLGQIDCQMRFLSTPSHVEPWMSRGTDGEVAYWAEGPNFGDGGMAYLFADRRCDPPRIKMFWQCL